MRLAGILVSSSALALAGMCQATAETPQELANFFGRSVSLDNPILSPDGKRLAVECAPNGSPTVCVFDFDSGAPAVQLPVITNTKYRGHYWGNNETIVVDIITFERLRSGIGMEDYELERAVAFNIKDPKPVLLMADHRNWVDANNLVSSLPAEDDKLLFAVTTLESDNSVNIRAKVDDSYTTYVIRTDLDTGRSRQVEKRTNDVVRVVVSPEGDIIADMAYEKVKTGEYRVRVTADRKVLFERDGVTYNPISIWGYEPQSGTLVVFIDEEDENAGIYKMSLTDGALTPVVFETGAPALVSAVYDPRSNDVVGYEYTVDQPKQIFEDEKLASHLAAIAPAFPGASVTLESWTDDRSESVVVVENGAAPLEYYIFESDTLSLSPVGSSDPHMAERTLATVEAITYDARDGLEINGYLTLPPGKTRSDGPYPLVLMPHGGPESRDRLTFDWWAQAYAAAGYAVLQPNFRGSAGFGQEFLAAGYGEFGGKMVTDTLDGVAWAVAEGIAEDNQVCSVGASYGGYSALMAALLSENGLACAISVNGITDPFQLASDSTLGSFSDNYLRRYLGVGRYENGEARDLASPVNRAREITIPTLLIAGKEDTTVPYKQFENFRRATDGATNFEFITLEGEDHYMQSSKSRYDVLLYTLEFLQKNLPVN